ncbi:MAG: hypothetical protein M0R20_01435 [Candidatus Omnitrophica bacterium]|jgi:hypothetical protein|nr:hypothetical protein [Candidatus Omnitrophota bacterium]
MDGMQNNKGINTKLKFSAAFRELIILGVVTVFVFMASYFLNIFNFLVKMFYENPKEIVYIDEIITVLLTLSIGFAVFAWRRWLELKRESAQRIRDEEMLREAAETEADVERIVSKQLRSDMDQIKQEIKQILFLLSGKGK